MDSGLSMQEYLSTVLLNSIKHIKYQLAKKKSAQKLRQFQQYGKAQSRDVEEESRRNQNRIANETTGNTCQKYSFID